MERKSSGGEHPIGGDETTGDGTLEIGSALGQYRILRPLGRSGMGATYEAENAVSGKRYALKTLPQAATADGNFADRFQIESRAMSDLDHPNVVRVHHAGEENGRYYLTMDWVAGADGEPRTLEDVLRGAGGKLKAEMVREWALQICDAVAHAHGKNVIHRDLKLSKVLIDAEGHAQVADFGLAQLMGSGYLKAAILGSLSMAQRGAGELKPGPGGCGTGNTSSVVLMDTYDYKAPEQKTGAEATPRTDVFALGVMLYRMLTGRKPEAMAKPPSRYGCSKPWDAIVRKCLEIEPAERYATAAELKRDVARVGRGFRSGRVLALVAAAAVLASGLAVAGAWKAGGIGSVGASALSRVGSGDGGPAEASESEESRGAGQPAAVAEAIIPGAPAPEDLAAGGGVDPSEPDVAPPAQEPPPPEPEVDYALVVAVKSEAEMKWRKAAALDRGKDYGAALDECEKTLNAAQTYFGDKYFAVAKDKYEAVVSECDRLLALEADRLRAAEAQASAERAQAEAKTAAEAAEAGPPRTQVELLMAAAQRKEAQAAAETAESSAAAGDEQPEKQRRPAGKKRPQAAAAPPPDLASAFSNSLGMEFLPVAGLTNVLFCKWETRVQDYEPFIRDAPRAWPKPRFLQEPMHPAVNVSRDDAQSFCAWLTAREQAQNRIKPDQKYRLPTDWEWSVAAGMPEAHAGTPQSKDRINRTNYPWTGGRGTWPPPGGAGNYHAGLRADLHAGTSAAGSFAANANGLFDLGGNVWEWCDDFYNGQNRAGLLRGGSWQSGRSGDLLSSCRYAAGPKELHPSFGFRVVLSN